MRTKKIISGFVPLLIAALLLTLSYTGCEKNSPIIFEGQLARARISLWFPQLAKPLQGDFAVTFTVYVQGGEAVTHLREVKNYYVQGSLEVPPEKNLWIEAEAEIDTQVYRGVSDTLFLSPGALATVPITLQPAIGPTPNHPPNPPSNPHPPDGATDQPLNVVLSWSCSDPDSGDVLSYDVYFGTGSVPSLISSGQSETTYRPAEELRSNQAYYWKIIARDSNYDQAESPIWSFTTGESANQPPLPPSNPSPPDGAANQSIDVDLSWTCSDPDPGDTLTYDVYFGTEVDIQLVSQGQYETFYDPGRLYPDTLYYWQIVAEDNQGASSTGPLWSFRTAPDSVVVFPDPNLEQAVRDHIHKPAGDIYVSDVDTITYFHADSADIQIIEGLEYFVSLNSLYLHQNQISDITLLQDLAQLVYLSLWSNQISNITPLQNLTGLTGLKLGINQISDITPLRGLTQLELLYLNNNQISDLNPLENLTQLTELWLTSNEVSDITPLENLTQLTYIWLSWNPISDITPLQNLTRVTSLLMSGTEIADITPLQNLTQLVTLDLSVNAISDLDPLTGLVNLETLHLSENQIFDIAALQYVTAIVTLNLRYNQIEDLTPLLYNLGMDNGDVLDVRDNPLNRNSLYQVIPALQQRGVTVYY